MKKLYEQAKKELLKADKILLISHRKPDADTLGANIALKLWLETLGKDLKMACIDRVSPAFSFLPYLDEFVRKIDPGDYDLIVVLDSGASYMTGFHEEYPDIFESGIPVLNIDHHASNDEFGSINIIDPSAASVTLMLFRMFATWEVQINEEMAFCLLAGIYNDTGGFMHSNTNEEVYSVSSELMNLGAKISEINQSLFRNKPVSSLRLWGKALEKVEINENNVAISIISSCDYEDLDVKPEQLSGVIDYLSMIEGTNFAVLINEDRKGHIKGSFRTRKESIDLSKIAANFGGGGHSKASGFCLKGRLVSEMKYEIEIENGEKKSLDF